MALSRRVLSGGKGLSILGVMLIVAPASAGVVDIGGGWEASWAPALDGLVDITSFGVSGNAVIIEKSAEFTEPPVAGVFAPIAITFTQTSAPAVPFIVIDDEIITNSTGADWTDFHMELLGATFDPALTGGGTGPIGWTVDPFTQAAFAGGNQLLDIWGGVVPNGSQWFPGDGVSNGHLYISAGPNSGPPFSSFVLVETPTPEPGTLALLGLAVLPLVRRRFTR